MIQLGVEDGFGITSCAMTQWQISFSFLPFILRVQDPFVMTDSTASLSGTLLWTPADDAVASSQVAAFASFVKTRTGMDWEG